MAPATNWLSFSLMSPMEMLRSSSESESSAGTNPKSEVFYTDGEKTEPNRPTLIHSQAYHRPTNTEPPTDSQARGLSRRLRWCATSDKPKQRTQDSSLTQIYDQCSTYFGDQSPAPGSQGDNWVSKPFRRTRAQKWRTRRRWPGISSACAEFTGHSVESSNREKAIVPVDTDSSKKISDTFGQRTSIYRGVTRHRWTGGYDMEDKAARAYDLAALKYWGPTATTNFPKELEDMKLVTKQEFIASLRRKSSGFSRGASMYRGVTRHHQQGVGKQE
ncbi:hypothetical protein M0R45_004899 [Rubus argutus]|uniref:AP2/ERF domain-containing protein n=1 Tax=Rubus argutus TaxID=59490 RepID=A0AAW1YL61_RUBAR